MSTDQSLSEMGAGATSGPIPPARDAGLLVRFVRRADQAQAGSQASAGPPCDDNRTVGPARRRVLSFPGSPWTDEEDMQNNETTPAAGTAPLRDIPIDWEALEDAFENNAPEVHSYLHLVTGDVLRVVDGVADPQMHARIAADSNYLRIDPVSSREQYRWMERYIPMVEDPDLQSKLGQAIDGKGAFRRFKDVLMAYAPERERWFAFRSERLRTFMEAWLSAHAIKTTPRPEWADGDTPESEPMPESVAASSASPSTADLEG